MKKTPLEQLDAATLERIQAAVKEGTQPRIICSIFRISLQTLMRIVDLYQLKQKVKK